MLDAVTGNRDFRIGGIAAISAGVVRVPANLRADSSLRLVGHQIVMIGVFFAVLRAALFADSSGIAACRTAAAAFRLGMAVVAGTGAGMRAVVIGYPVAIVVLQRRDFFFGGIVADPANNIVVPAAFRAGRGLGSVKHQISNVMIAEFIAVFFLALIAHGRFGAGRRAAGMRPLTGASFAAARITTDCRRMICFINFFKA